MFDLLKLGLRGGRPPRQLPPTPALKPSYDVVIIGGGGHGLACAYYLARTWGITNVAVLEQGYLERVGLLKTFVQQITDGFHDLLQSLAGQSPDLSDNQLGISSKQFRRPCITNHPERSRTKVIVRKFDCTRI